MKQNAIIFVLLLIVAATIYVGGFFHGRNTVKEVHTTVPAQLNIDSLTNLIAEARVRTEDLDSMIEANEVLRALLARRPVITKVVRGLDSPDTLPPWTPHTRVETFSANIETSATVYGEVYQGEDTLQAETRARLSIDVKAIGNPANVVIVEKLKISPFRIALPVKERVRDALPGADWNSWFSMHGIGGWNGSPAVGGVVHIGWLGAGVIVNKSEPIWFGTFRIGH